MEKQKIAEPINGKEMTTDWRQRDMMLKQLGVIAGRVDGQRKEQKCRMLVLALLQVITILMLILLTLKLW